MLRNSLFALLAGLLLFTGCPAPQDTPDISVGILNGNIAKPDTSYSLLSAFTAALPCNGQALVWSIREQTIGWSISTDGSITQSGVWTSPACGSVWLGQQMHIDAVCVASGQTATAIVATVPEQVSGVQIAFAVVTNIGQASCLAANPASPTVQPGGTIQFYARVNTTCGSVVTPTPPATWPATCP